MTVAALTPYKAYSGNGSTFVFAAPFRFLAASHLELTIEDADGIVTALALGADYSVAGGSSDSGGTVTLTTPPAAGETLKIRRQTPRAQEADYTTGDNFPAEAHELALDRLMLIAQEQDLALAEMEARTLRVPAPETVAELPARAVRALRALAFDASGNPAAGPLTSNLEAAVSAFLSQMVPAGMNTVPTIATLTALAKANLTDGDFINAMGYRAKDGFGGGPFEWVAGSTATEVPGYVMAADEGGAGRWFRRGIPPVVIPEMSGAVGDYIADDTEAVAIAKDTGLTVYSPCGQAYRLTDDIVLETDHQGFGGDALFGFEGDFGVVLDGFAQGPHLSINHWAPAHTGTVIKVLDAERVIIEKLYCLNGHSMVYVENCNSCTIDWAWGIVRGAGLHWYGDDDKRSDILAVHQFIVRPGDGEYGFIWDGNCHSLYAASLQIVEGKGGIIRNTASSTQPAIGRFFEYASDYSEDKGFEIADGVIPSDIDFCAPYILGAQGDGLYIGDAVNANEVRVYGGKIRANGVSGSGWGINNQGGYQLFGGTTDMYTPFGDGSFNGTVRSMNPRYDLNDEATKGMLLQGGDTVIAGGPTDFFSFDSAGDAWRWSINSTFFQVMSEEYVQFFVPAILPEYTAAELAALDPKVPYMMAFATDSNATLAAGHGNTLAGGGANIVKVHYTADWTIG